MKLSEKIRSLTDKQICHFNSTPIGHVDFQKNYADMIGIQELTGEEVEETVSLEEVIKGLNEVKYQDEYDEICDEIAGYVKIVMGKQGGREGNVIGRPIR